MQIAGEEMCFDVCHWRDTGRTKQPLKMAHSRKRWCLGLQGTRCASVHIGLRQGEASSGWMPLITQCYVLCTILHAVSYWLRVTLAEFTSTPSRKGISAYGIEQYPCTQVNSELHSE